VCRPANACNTEKLCSGNDAGCAPNTDVSFGGNCYYLDGTNGVCLPGYTMQPQSVLTTIASGFVGLTWKTQTFNNCCVKHALQGMPPCGAAPNECQDWGMGGGDCTPSTVPWTTGPIPGGASCTNANQNYTAQLTLCGTGSAPDAGPTKRIFASQNINGGSFLGVAGGDNRCMTDLNKPTGGVWKALLVDTSTRVAFPLASRVDWVLQANTNYVRATDGVTTFITGIDALPTFPIAAPMASASAPWTGMNADWSSSTSNCLNWTDSLSLGVSGNGSLTTSAAINNGTANCSTVHNLICVEQ
jgi:hypothetical protein